MHKLYVQYTLTPNIISPDCLCVKSQGLWELYSDMELNMISVLAGKDHNACFVPADTEDIF